MQNAYGSKNEKKYHAFKDLGQKPPSLVINLNSRQNLSKQFKTFNLPEHTDQLKADFDFKHVSKFELESILKKVRRERRKQQDEANWNAYVKSKLEKEAEVINENSCDLNYPNGITTCGECGLLTPTEPSNSVKANAVVEEIISDYGNSTIDANQSHSYQFGPGLMKRLQDLLDTVRKMTAILLNPCPETQHEDEDIERTIKRSLEFDAMFARNHLYDIQRLLKDMKQTITGKNVILLELENKVSAILKAVAQALQIYTKHVSKGARVKYQQVVPIFQCITTTLSILENLSGDRLFPLRQDLEVSCSYLKQVMLDLGATETRSVTTVSNKASKFRLKRKPSEDLSMYSRRQREWRRKTASLARARFGPPTSEKKCKIPVSPVMKNACVVPNKTKSRDRVTEDSNTNNKVNKMQSSESVNSKESPFRSATRAVPEENVTTMIEMIPQEGEMISKWNPQGEHLPRKQKSDKEPNGNKEVSNVQLVCVRERPDTTNSTCKLDDHECGQNENKTMIIESSVQAELLEYQQKISNYQESSPLYKDGKALGIIDRLASRILKEMLTDFQQNEMDHVIRTLYNLEFE